MTKADRLGCYEAIEEYRDRPLIAYVTSTRPGVKAIMAGDAVRVLIDQIALIDDSPEVDILIHSTGGDALAAWKLMSVLRETFDQVDVLVPFMGFSAATLFALGADEIVMHPYASLGPIDPQITMNYPDGTQRRFSYEDVGAFLRFLADEVGITEQVHVSSIGDKLFSVVDPLSVGSAKRASELSSSVGERLLLMHMEGPEDKARAEQIAENLNKSFFAHSDAVSRTRAIGLGLSIAEVDEKLEQLLWQAYLEIEQHMQFDKPFDPSIEYLNDSNGAKLLQPAGPIILPPNTPNQVADQVWTAAANRALSQATSTPQVPYSVINAMIESTRMSAEYHTSGYITAFRQPNGEIHPVVTRTDIGWRTISEDNNDDSPPKERDHGND
jgi:hypothetical protein